MTTLVIHAPSGKVHQESKRSFDETLQHGIGDRYAIDSKRHRLVYPGCRIVLLDKDKRQRAEGRLVELEETGKTTGGGMRRYNVHMENMVIVPYKSEDLTRWGIAVIE